MKKFTFLTTALALFAFLAIPLGMRGQTTATFEPADFSGQGTSGTGSAISATVDGVTFACNKGYGTTQIRCYKDGVITISSENEITALDFTFSGTYNGGLETSYSDLSTYSWEYTLTSQARFTEIVVTYSGTPAETHTLYFSPNEWGYGTIAVGDNTSGTISLAEGATVDITATATDHHAFMFWEIEEGEGSSVANEYSTSTTFTMGTEDATLVGNFYALTTYTVFYEPNMAGVQDIMVTYDEGDDVIVAANTFTNPGYVFTGWNTEGDGTGDSYQPNDTIEDIQDDILLYAQWEQTTEVVDVLNWAATGSPTNYTDWTYTAPSGAAYKGQSSGTYQSIQLRSSNNNSGIVTTTSIGNVTKVTVAWNSNTVNGRTLNVYGSNTAYTSPTQLYGDNIVGDLLGTIVCGTDTVLNITGNYAYIGLRSAANAMYLDKIKITWASDGVVPPSITADDVEIAYNATSGSFTFTVSNPVEGGNLTVAENVEWIDEAEINTLTNGYSVTFATTVNEAGMAREGVITLTYSYNRQTVTKDVTVTQAGNPNVVDNISDITEVGADYHVKGMVVGASNKGFVICDGTGLVYTYLNAVPTYQVGNFVQITGTTGSYGHVIQFTNSATIAEADVFTFDWPEYTVITEVPDYTEGYHLSDYFQFEGTLTKSGTNYLVAVGEGQIRISYPTTEQAEDLETLLNKTVRIHGFFTGYSGTGENAVFTAMMESYEEVVAPAVPSITIDPDNFSLDANSHMGESLTQIAYQNIIVVPGSGYNTFAAHYYDAEGQETAYDWCVVSALAQADADSVFNFAVFLDPNVGDEARTAYIKLSALDTDNNQVYSNLVTITQAAAPGVTHTVTFNENGQVAETLEIAEGEMGDNLPTAAFGTVPANSKFVGWSLTPVTDYTAGNYFTTEAPVMVDTTYNLTGDVTFYAVYATVRQEEYGEKGWVKVTSTDRFLAGDRFLMVNETHGKVAGDIEQQVMQPYDATFEDGFITSELPDSIFVLWLWNQGIEGSWTLRYYSPGYDSDLNGSWLAATAAKKLTWIAPTDTASYNKSQYSWFISFDNDGNVIIQNGVQEYGRFLYNASSPRFTTYTSNPTSNMLLPQLYRSQGVYTEYNDYYFSQITEQNESVDITDNVVWPYNYTITDNAIVNIEENGLLSVEGLLFNTDPTQLVIKDGGQLKISNKVRAGTIQKNIIGYVNEETNNGNYYLLGLPMNWSYDKAVASGMVGLFPNFGDVDVYHFSPNKDGEEWGNLKAYGDPEPTLAGIYAYFGSNVHQPYLYANKNDVVLSFATEATDATDGFYATNVDESEPATRMSGHNFTGWNLIRNPYTCNAYLRSGRDFYRMNDAGDAIVLATDNVIKPCEAIFVVVAAENDPEQTANYPGVVMARVYFTTTEPTPAGDESKLDVKLSRNGQVLDVARVRFDEGDMNGKMVLNEGTTRLSIAQGNKDYSIVRSQGQGEMPVSFKADANGTYTISVDADNIDMNYMHLIDNMTGADVDLLQTPSYSFEASIGDYASRFRLVFSGASTGTSADENFAFFSNGNLIITNDGNATLQVIDLTGRVLSSKTISGICSTSIDAPTGVYMLRLINGDNVKVQKVVVR